MPVQCEFSLLQRWAVVEQQAWFPGKRVLVLVPLQWCSWRMVVSVIGHSCNPCGWCAGRCWHYSFLGSDSVGLAAGMCPYLCSSGSWRAVLRTSERATALFGNPVSYSFSLCARQPLQRESSSEDASPLFLSLSEPRSFQNNLEMRNIPFTSGEAWNGKPQTLEFKPQLPPLTCVTLGILFKSPWALVSSFVEMICITLQGWCGKRRDSGFAWHRRVYTVNGGYLLVTSKRVSVVGAVWITVGSAIPSGLSWIGPGSLGHSRGIPVPVHTPHHHQNFA